ncbi:MAG: CopG family transcriptional regulator [Halanaerobiales bacterium]
MSDKATIKIPRNLYNKLNKVIENTGFNSVTEFIVYIMRDIASTAEMEKEKTSSDPQALTGEEIEMIRKRLKSLGYLD